MANRKDMAIGISQMFMIIATIAVFYIIYKKKKDSMTLNLV